MNPGPAVKIVGNVEAAGQRRVKNDGPNSAYVSKDPAVTAASASAFVIPLNAEETIWLAAGEELYAAVAAAQAASIEVI